MLTAIFQKQTIHIIEAIKYKTASSINRCIKTNSVPFELLCEDGEIHYAKTTFKRNAPYDELINEIVCNYLLKSWGVITAVPVIIHIPKKVYDAFVSEGNFRDSRYNSFDFENKLFFGVERLQATELELYNSVLKNKADYNKYANPCDLLKIGVFDKWIGNNDRRVENPNILLTHNGEKFDFVAIDHTEAFGYQDNYKALKPALMNTARANSILSTSMSKSIITFAGPNFITKFDGEILECIKKAIEDLDFVLNQIPSSFGLSKKGKEKIKEILSLEQRNIDISKSFLNYVK